MDCRTEAREFLQSRRARLSPTIAGLVAGSTRRRVPGLRREEVAQLAGISADYYARLEKGHLETASPAVLEAIARALQLDPAERSHLHDLARAARGEEAQETSRPSGAAAVRPSHLWMLDAMTLSPAYIRNSRLEVLASNALGRALYEPLFDSGVETPNLALFCFLDERAREMFPEWADVARGMMALLRSELGRNSSDPDLNRLVDQLMSQSEAFRAFWPSHNVRQAPAHTAQMHHPSVGTLSLAVEAMNLAAHPGLTMVAYAAEPGSTSELGLSRLSSRVGAHASD